MTKGKSQPPARGRKPARSPAAQVPEPSSRDPNLEGVRAAIDAAEEIAAIAGPVELPDDAPASADDGATPPGRRRRRPLKSNMLLECLEEDVTLWLSTSGEAFATIPVAQHWENVPVGSKRFEEFAVDRYYRSYASAPGKTTVQEIVGLLGAKARNTRRIFETFIRVGHRNGELWIDLGDADWRSVRVTPHRWTIENNAPIKFLRNGAMRPLPVPEAGGLIEELRTFVNCGSDDDFKLLVGWLIGAFRPRGPYPMLAVDGPQGAAKSTLSKICRALVDPNAAPLRSAPGKEEDLLIAADNSWVVALDNQSEMSSWLSDALCRLATGAGLSTREFYTNKGEVWFSASRPIILNGIPGVGSRADLVDRCIALTLPAMEETHRRTERELWRQFEEASPRIFGALLDGLVCAVRDEESIPSPPTRMADFAAWCVAASPGVGWEDGEFLRAYDENRRGANKTVIEADPVAEAVVKLLESREGDGQPVIETTPTVLLTELATIVAAEPGGSAVLNSKLWPASNKLRARLRRAQEPLRRAGILLDLDARSSDPRRDRIIRIRRP